MKPITSTLLTRRLKKLGHEAEEVTSHLNCGGCGVYASIVLKRLRELGVDAKAVVASPGLRRIESVRPRDNLNPTEWRNILIAHVGLAITLNGRTRLYDSEGFAPMSKKQLPAIGCCSVADDYLLDDELYALADYAPMWNHLFDRDLIPQIEQLADKCLSGLQPINPPTTH